MVERAKRAEPVGTAACCSVGRASRCCARLLLLLLLLLLLAACGARCIVSQGTSTRQLPTASPFLRFRGRALPIGKTVRGMRRAAESELSGREACPRGWCGHPSGSLAVGRNLGTLRLLLGAAYLCSGAVVIGCLGPMVGTVVVTCGQKRGTGTSAPRAPGNAPKATRAKPTR